MLILLGMALTSLGYIVKGEAAPADYGAMVFSLIMLGYFAYASLRDHHARSGGGADREGR